jgi:hypothetical protein
MKSTSTCVETLLPAAEMVAGPALVEEIVTVAAPEESVFTVAVLVPVDVNVPRVVAKVTGCAFTGVPEFTHVTLTVLLDPILISAPCAGVENENC